MHRPGDSVAGHPGDPGVDPGDQVGHWRPCAGMLRNPGVRRGDSLKLNVSKLGLVT